ncbi:MAG: hypothetical protein AAGU11_14155 [Syntrophobacteraceae bacterium]
MGIRAKILSIAAVILIIGIVAEGMMCGYIFTREYSKALKAGAQSMGESLRAQLDRIFSLGLPLNELVGFEKQCQELVGRNKDLAYAMVVDLNGKILFSSDPSQHGKPLRAVVPESIEIGWEGAFFKDRNRDTYEVLIPVLSGQHEKIAAIHIGISASTITEKVDYLIKYTILVSVAALLLAWALLLMALGKWVTGPLSGLFQSIQRLRRNEQGAYSKLALPYKGEIGMVSSAVDSLIDDLNSSHKLLSSHAEKLELVVQNRTAELKTLNEQLRCDIEERKKVENALRASEAFINVIMDKLPIGIAVNTVHPVVTFIYMNDNFARFYRTTRDALANPDAFWETVYEDPTFREEIRQRVSDDFASGDPERFYWPDIPINKPRKSA